MRHFVSPAFCEAYAKLPDTVRALADKNYALLTDNPQHPSLHLRCDDQVAAARSPDGAKRNPG
jgi:hypothetical protein